MSQIKLIAFDLDGTLLNDDKKITERTYRALLAAAEKGIHLVPATGRLDGALPREFDDLPIRYVISINGALVYERKTMRPIHEVLIPWQQALDIYRYMEEHLPVIYDCYIDSRAYMTKAFHDDLAPYACNVHYLKMMKELRTPVPELKAFLAEKQQGLQKMQCFFREKDYPLRDHLLENWKIPGIIITSSTPHNLELNHEKATKGDALAVLAEHLGLELSETMALGDGSNDLTMIQRAGIGVAMGVCWEPLKKAADFVTDDCNHDGVAKAIEKFCL